MLEISKLVFAFGALRVIDQLDLEVTHGAIHGLIGPNGAGKTTTIDLVSGRHKARSGAIRFAGHDITALSPGARRSLGISRSFQRISVFQNLTVGDQLDLAARALDEQDPDAIVNLLGLGDSLARPCQQIGYGEQRRVDIALALFGQPTLLLLDEPAAGLSRDESLVLADTLRSFVRERDLTVVLVEHDLEVVFAVCDRLTVLDGGVVIADGAPETVRRDPQVISAYLGSAA